MEALVELFKQIGNIDSTIKLIAFLASLFFLTVSVILSNSSKISKRVANILYFFFGGIFLLALLAMISPMFGKRTDALTLTLTLIDHAGSPYSSDQADFTVNSKTASVDYSPLAKVWTIVFAPEELPKDRRIYLFAQTKDHNFRADTLLLLTSALFQTCQLQLSGKDTVLADTTFSINLPDGQLRQDIARLTGWIYDPNSRKNRIVVTYDPSSIRANHTSPNTNPIYYFVSSPPVVLIDGQRFTLDNCSIPERVPNFTRDRESLRTYAQAQSISIATAYFRRNPNILVRWIKPR